MPKVSIFEAIAKAQRPFDFEVIAERIVGEGLADAPEAEALRSRLRELDINVPEGIRDYALRIITGEGAPIWEEIYKAFMLVNSLVALERIGVDGASDALTVVGRALRERAKIDHRYADERHRLYGHGLPEWWTR